MMPRDWTLNALKAFFASSGDYRSIYHVGLYIGDGQMIEAPYTGESVRVSSIWRSSLFGAARP